MNKSIMALCAALAALVIASPLKALEVNGKAYVFGAKVNLRQEPDIKSPVIVLLKDGEEVKVLEKTNKFYNSDGVTDVWYRVKSRTATGYVWGGVLAHGHAADFNGDGAPDVFMSRGRSLGESRSEINVRLVSGEKLLRAFDYASVLPDPIVTSVRFLGKSGFKPEIPIVGVSYMNGDPAVTGEIFFHFKGRTVVPVVDVQYSFTSDSMGTKDCPTVHDESTVAFPADKDGKSNAVVVKTKKGCFVKGKKKKEEFRVEKTHERKFTWDGASFREKR